MKVSGKRGEEEEGKQAKRGKRDWERRRQKMGKRGGWLLATGQRAHEAARVLLLKLLLKIEKTS